MHKIEQNQNMSEQPTIKNILRFAHNISDTFKVDYNTIIQLQIFFN